MCLFPHLYGWQPTQDRTACDASVGADALHWAVDGDAPEVALFLIKQGAEVDRRDSVGLWTPLCRAGEACGGAGAGVVVQVVMGVLFGYPFI